MKGFAHTYLGIIFIFFLSEANGQGLFYNNGAEVYVHPGAYMIVKTNTLENAAGRFENGGHVVIEEDFINSDTATGFNTYGRYDVYGDWINNDLFRADFSRVNLLGADQLITGSAVTAFFDLSLQGTGIKRQTINSQVMDSLLLNDRELATDQHEMWFSNPDPGAITRATGFVSSLDTGRLARNTNRVADYWYYTGSSLGTPRYRPVVMRPEDTYSNTYGVRFANIDPTLEGYDREIKSIDICEVNPEFYHRIYRTSGTSPSDITIYFDEIMDGDWATMAHWQNVPQWEDLWPVIRGSGNPFSTTTVKDWDDYTYSPFALASQAPRVTAYGDTAIFRTFSAPLNATSNLSDVEYTWSPDMWLDCIYCPDPVTTPDESITYYVEVTNNSTCSAIDSVYIKVRTNENLYVPSAFTPNGDGVNDFARVLGATELVGEIEFMIFNRWGEKVFEANNLMDAMHGWDGRYKGKPQDVATFTYYLRATKINKPEDELLQGNVTIIR